ncbi:MAG: ABC transporter permease [Betaproteobacteria bacterium]|nr:ABC transporter permease [Betaproteobacteria bacterium]
MHHRVHELARRLAALPGVAYILVLQAIVFGSVAQGFLSPLNLTNIGTQATILLMLALPMTLVILTEGLDISMGAVLTLCSVVLAWVLVHGGGIGLALAASAAMGLAFGVANGTLVSYLGMPPFVATLGTLGMAQGLALAITDGQSIVGISAQIAFMRADVLGIPLVLIIAFVAYFFVHALLYYTRFGTYVFAIGGNREALALAGVHARAWHAGVYVFAGLMVGITGLLLVARTNSGHPTAAFGMEFDAIAAVAVGGTSFERGEGWLFGTLLGVLAVGVMRNGLNVAGVSSSLQVVAIGLLVIAALLIDALRRRA